jgi:hypothetical protein
MLIENAFKIAQDKLDKFKNYESLKIYFFLIGRGKSDLATIEGVKCSFSLFSQFETRHGHWLDVLPSSVHHGTQATKHWFRYLDLFLNVISRDENGQKQVRNPSRVFVSIFLSGNCIRFEKEKSKMKSRLQTYGDKIQTELES